MRKFSLIPGEGENSGSGFTEHLLPTFFDTSAVAQYKISNESCIVPALFNFSSTRAWAGNVARLVWMKRDDGIWQRHPSVFRDTENRLIILLVVGRYLRFSSSKYGREVWSQAKDLSLTVGNRHQIGAIFAKTA